MKSIPSPEISEGRPVSRNSAQRLGNFFLSLGIMALSFVFYSLGLFGDVEGPLNPARLGSTLAALGLTKQHLIALLLTLSIFATVWDRLFNAVYRRTGARRICAYKEKDQPKPCGSAVKRETNTRRQTDQTRVRYVCEKGHRCAESDFKPWCKGPLSRSVGLCSLVFLTAIFLS